MFSPNMFQCLIFFFSKETEYKTFIAFVSHTALDERKQDLTYNQMWVNKDAIPTAKIIACSVVPLQCECILVFF